LQEIAETSKRLEIVAFLVAAFRAILDTHPPDLLPAVYLCVNRVAPAHTGIELGIGEAALVKVGRGSWPWWCGVAGRWWRSVDGMGEVRGGGTPRRPHRCLLAPLTCSPALRPASLKSRALGIPPRVCGFVSHPERAFFLSPALQPGRLPRGLRPLLPRR
jgi:hypothetical protein